MSESAIAAIERILAETVEADDVLRGTVTALVADPAIVWAAIGFLDEGSLTTGPAAGVPDETQRVAVPIAFQDAVVGELWVDGTSDRATLKRIASLIAPQVLIGWDTGGEAWEP